MAKNRSPTSILIVTTVSHIMQHVYVGSSILLPMIFEDLKLNYSEFGLAIAVSSLLGGLFQVVFGIASRRIARHILLGLGNIMLSIGTFLTGLSRGLIDFLCARLLSNIGVAPQHPMGTAIISEAFDEKSRGKAIGFHYGVAYIGNIIGPIIMTILSITFGWRSTLCFFSIPIFIVGLMITWYLSASEEKGNRSGKGEESEKTRLAGDVILLMKTRGIILVLTAQALNSGGIDLGILTTYIPIFLANFLEMDAYERGIVYTIGLLGGVIGPVLMGNYAIRIGYIRTSAISALLASLLTYILTSHSVGAASIIVALHLFALMFLSFSLPTLMQSYMASITSGYNRDLAVGIYFTMNSISSSLWVWIIGQLIDVYSSFKPVLIFMSSLGLISSTILISQFKKKI